MYEKFTDRARKSMVLANQEACARNHEYIGCEHVLIGILREGGGVACEVLSDFGITLQDAREIAARLTPNGPDMVTMGKMPQTPDCRAALEAAIAAGRVHGYVGTEHMLYGLLSDSEMASAKILGSIGHGIDIGAVRTAITEIWGKPHKSEPKQPEDVEAWKLRVDLAHAQGLIKGMEIGIAALKEENAMLRKQLGW